MTAQKPTRMQALLLRFIAERISKEGWAPTLEEMAEHFTWRSSSTAFFHVAGLERRGLVERRSGATRALRLTPAGQREVA